MTGTASRPGPFPPEEHAARVRALQEGMAEHGIDALLLTTPADVFHVTGFLTRFWESPTRPWFVLVPASGTPVAVIPSIGVPLMARTWIRDIRSWEAPDPADDGVGLLAATVTGVIGPRGRLGVPMGAETHLRMPLADFFRLREVIAPRIVVDATEVVRRVREVKSEAEIACIGAACAVAERAFARVPEVAGAGAGLAGVFRSFQRLLLEEGADWVAYLAGGAGVDGYADVISPASARPLAAGEVLMLDTGAVLAGHYCDFDRNFAIGRAAPGVRAAHAALVEATLEAASAMRPGMAACEVRDRLARALCRAGWQPAPGRFGHGLGLALTEWPSLSPHDRTVLRENMVLTLEPAVRTGPGRVLVHEEVVVLRARGAVFLSGPAAPAIPEID